MSRFLLALLTVFGKLFPNVGLNFEYKHLPIEFEIESVSDKITVAKIRVTE